MVWRTVKTKNRKNNNGHRCTNDKILPIPLVIITGCDTGLGYSVVLRYLNENHYTMNQNYSYLYNLPGFNYKKLIIPSKIAVVAFCLNPTGPGPNCLIKHSLKNKKIILFVKQLDLTNSNSIKNGVTFVTDLLQENYENNKLSETGCFKYSQ